MVKAGGYCGPYVQIEYRMPVSTAMPLGAVDLMASTSPPTVLQTCTVNTLLIELLIVANLNNETSPNTGGS